MFNLSDLDTAKASDEGRLLHFLNPGDGQPLWHEEPEEPEDGDFDKGIEGKPGKPGKPFAFLMAGPDSKAWKSWQSRRFRADQEAIEKAKGKPIPDNFETRMERAVDLCASLTLGWETFELDGAQFEYSAENARKVFSRFEWMREQAERFVGVRANFLQKSKMP